MAVPIKPGFITPSQAAALNSSMRQVTGLEVSGLGAGVGRVGGVNGQYLHLPPPPPPASKITKSITDACLVPDGYGGVAGLALFEEYSDGRGRCRVVGFCADCGPESVPPPPSAPCVTVSGTVTFQPEATLAAGAGLNIVGYGLFTADDGTYSVDLTFHSATLGFTCGCPVGEVDPRDVYYSLDGGASWTLAGTDCAGGFSLVLPTACDPVEVLWELWEEGMSPEVVNPPVEEETPP